MKKRLIAFGIVFGPILVAWLFFTGVSSGLIGLVFGGAVAALWFRRKRKRIAGREPDPDLFNGPGE